jgi:hypothetical protein
MTHRPRRLWRPVTISVIVVAVAIIGYLGFVGGRSSITAGTQGDVCGVRVGVVEAGGGAADSAWGGGQATITWGDDGRASLAQGQRARLAPWCVVEIAWFDRETDADADGGGPVVTLIWRLW